MKVKIDSFCLLQSDSLVPHTGTETKAKGSQDLIEILAEDEDEVSPLPKSSLGEWNSERKQVRNTTGPK